VRVVFRGMRGGVVHRAARHFDGPSGRRQRFCAAPGAASSCRAQPATMSSAVRGAGSASWTAPRVAIRFLPCSSPDAGRVFIHVAALGCRGLGGVLAQRFGPCPCAGASRPAGSTPHQPGADPPRRCRGRRSRQRPSHLAAGGRADLVPRQSSTVPFSSAVTPGLLDAHSRRPVRQRERAMNGFRSVGGAQRFLSAFSGISPPSAPPPTPDERHGAPPRGGRPLRPLGPHHLEHRSARHGVTHHPTPRPTTPAHAHGHPHTQQRDNASVEDGVVDAAQALAHAHAQFLVEVGPGALVDVQGVGPPAGPVQGDHVVARQVFPERVAAYIGPQ